MWIVPPSNVVANVLKFALVTILAPAIQPSSVRYNVLPPMPPEVIIELPATVAVLTAVPVDVTVTKLPYLAYKLDQ